MNRFSLLWLVVAFLLLSTVWAVLTSLAGATILGTWNRALPSAINAMAWAIVSADLWLPPYAIVLLAWPRLAAAFPSIERTASSLAISAAMLALPAALIVGASYPRFPFAVPFAIAFVTAWISLLLPRLAVPALLPGRFLESHSNRDRLLL